MMPLPPGCKVTYSVWLDIDRLTDDIVEWFEMIGGRVHTDIFWDHRSNVQNVKYVSYGKGKWCHYHQNGIGTRLHFLGEDASVASMFLLKFNEHVTNHNMQAAMARYQREVDAGIH
jgi:hypothetical protein